jgi:hypothetical protein
MCRHVHVRLTPSDENAVRKMYGVMVPVFASIVLLLFGAITLKLPPRAGEALTAEAAPVADRR